MKHNMSVGQRQSVHPVFSWGAVSCAVQGGSNLQVRPSVVLSVTWNKGAKVVICCNFP